jgi:SAM-dependent MidA family methyltransferase
MEINLAARDLIRDCSRVVERGLLMVIDYGGSSGDLVQRASTGGTLRAFRGHTVSGDVLRCPGSGDLTADVNFTDLILWGAEQGWEMVHEGSQRDFLMGLGLMEEVAALSRDITGPDRLAAYLSAKRFLMPEGLQERFRVLVLGRGLSLPAVEAGQSLWI